MSGEGNKHSNPQRQSQELRSGIMHDDDDDAS
jgi:hypothetical protein